MTQFSLPNNKVVRTYISQGEFAIEKGPDAVISTLLGSCVSACLWDESSEIGGMNHVLFCDDTQNAEEVFGHGVNGMELLINGMIHMGARRNNMKAKVFGGAQMIAGLSDAGVRNGEFVISFLKKENIPYVGGDLGGNKARRLDFWPGTGCVRQKMVARDLPLIKHGMVKRNDVELF
ncbi:Chemoreceptor glutamine deamidase CheD [Aliiroseovarius sp. xm-m-379]|uniref:chemotaxis protein CheD n=1 Tax=unclassified Aliiroseovarius TaxID=2623558 RepID=UPI001569C3A0|nr:MULTISPECIES: chemotaxis protein CheD [unclassified Aliiroseovarius]NRP12145.1 Chemoreceptor glutamine deamidase CheD [Aliiroseovarius sp. xm-d-517]NRP25373.1 Chemoreceptor glutamine deamidase CheD [Aliiroseovarius sp. xm-m-379]NRP30898.1 Chemoreceptor glutamine deamidase CheD [Aliiroseovarius sp. xm-m-314]NRP34172.1 Chemoreceptor glutamine deamidase CheD [Aliiroseovarius sp. xm-a-104]NRP41361.1 Chemoreceptor glutamine deamidase CheD [Aliiroseovarius sp. xm-m-339-2]